MVTIYLLGLLFCIIGCTFASPYRAFLAPAASGGGSDITKQRCVTEAQNLGYDAPSSAFPFVKGAPELATWDPEKNVVSSVDESIVIASGEDFLNGVLTKSLVQAGVCSSGAIWTGYTSGSGGDCEQWTSSSAEVIGFITGCGATNWNSQSIDEPCNVGTRRYLCLHVAPTTSPSQSPSKTPSQTPSKTPSKSPSRTPSKTPSRSPSIAPTDSPATFAPTKSPTRKTPSPVTDAPGSDGSDASGAEFNVQEYAVPIGVGAGGLAVALGLVGVYFVVRRKQKRLALRQSLANAGK